jgi:hypothetical protein
MKNKKTSRSTTLKPTARGTRTKKAGLSRNAGPLTRAHHHAKRVIRMTPMFVHGAIAGAFIGIVVVMSLRSAVPVNALTLSSVRDCDTNAVINCGALTTTELQQRYKNKGVAPIYSYFGISAQDIAATGTTAVAGRVYKNGTVTAGNKTVATAAVTAGRENITGSTKVTSSGVTFYKRAPSVSFRVDSIAAFVILQDGQFKYAILGACGNPVMATAVPKEVAPPPAPAPVETPDVAPPAAETPAPTVSTQTPESKPTVVLASQPAAQPLPNTGPGAIAVVGILAIVGGYLFHATHRHVKHKRRMRHLSHS